MSIELRLTQWKKTGIATFFLVVMLCGTLLSVNLRIGAVAGLSVGIMIGIFLSVGVIKLNRLCDTKKDMFFISVYVLLSYLVLGMLAGFMSSSILIALFTILHRPLVPSILFSICFSASLFPFLFWHLQSRFTAIHYESPNHRFISGPLNTLFVLSVKNLLFTLGIIILSVSIVYLTSFIVNRINILLGLVLFVFLCILIGTAGWLAFRQSAIVVPPEKDSVLQKNAAHNKVSNSRNILVIGLDGLCWDVINPLLERGYLSNMASLIKDGSSGYLQTIAPTFTPAIWTSIATGKLPVKHGIMDFRVCTFKGMTGSVRQFPPYFGVKGILERIDNIIPFDLIKYMPVTSELWMSRPVWDVLSEYEKKVGIVGWYPTWPVYEINGFLVTERAHCLDLEKCVYPDILREEVNPFIELRHQCNRPSLETVLAAGPLTEGIDQFIELSDMKDDLLPLDSNSRHELEILKFEYLKDKTYMNIAHHSFGRFHDMDFRAVYLHGPDAVAHNFWKWREPEYFRDVDENDIRIFSKVVDKYYIHIDKFIGRLLQNIDENTVVMIISDHGERPLYGGHWRHRTQTTHDLSTPGVIILWGKDIKKGQKLAEAGVLDITPTILYLMNLPVGHDMDGKVLTEAIDNRLLKELPVKYISSYGKWERGSLKPSTSSADAEIERRLRGLGYID